MRPVVTFISIVLVLMGSTTNGYAAVHNKGKSANSGSTVLSELAHSSSVSVTNPNVLALYNLLNIRKGDLVGELLMPTLKQRFPIYEGTDNSELKMGVGHYVKSVFPGISDNSVLSAHRDTYFSKLGNLKIGDLIQVDTKAGKFTYKIFNFRIVKANDRTVIVPTKNAVLTLSTCYPFLYIGHAPKRFIVSAKIVSQINPL